MKENKLPSVIRQMNKKHHYEEKDLLAVAATDMNVEGEYAKGYLVLTKEALLVYQAPHSTSQVNYFKGYSLLIDQLKEEDTEDFAVQVIPLEEISDLHMETQVSCNTLVMCRGDITYQLIAFSNTCRKNVVKLINQWEQSTHPKDEQEQIEDEDEELCCPKCGRMYPDPERKICPKCMDRKSIFIRIMKYYFRYKLPLAIMLLCFIGTAALNLLWPYLGGTVLYDDVLAKNGGALQQYGIADGKYLLALLLLVGIMLLTKLGLLLLQIGHGCCTAKVVTSVVRDMTQDVFRAMGKLSLGFFRSRQTGSLMTRVLSDVTRVTEFFIDGFPYLFVHGFTIIASVVVMAAINWQMTIITICMLPILIAISMYLRPRIWNLYGKRHRAERSVNSQVNDNLTGARVVKSFGQERREVQRFEDANVRLQNSEIVIAWQQNMFYLIYGAAQEIATITIWIIGVYMILGKQTMELGVLITFIGYVAQLSGPMNFFAKVFNWWTDSMNSAQRMFEILDSVPTIVEKENPIALHNPKGNIELKHVTFGYEANRQVLKDVSLKIPSGQMLGIVGRSGAGKTTLVNLISRMYDTQEGSILIDGVDVKDLAFKDLRRNVAMVSQETFIFMGTVAENIAYANPDATMEEIILATKLASAHEFIMRMPDGYDTKIGSSGRELSGGERQRISIARAVLANPKILILDEATASVDTETEQAIQQSINYLVKGRTTISIAHRLSTLRDADYLVVLDDGKITERGTHQELENLKGTYYKLMELQMKALALKSLD